MSLSYVLKTNLVGPPGAAGRTIYNAAGAPTASTGAVGDFYIDTAGYVLYGPKTSATAWPATGRSLVGPAGASTPQTLPSDLTANSLVVAPVAGDSKAEQIQLLDASGNVKFLVDAAGNATAASTAQASSVVVTATSTANANGRVPSTVVLPGDFGGADTTRLKSGISSDKLGNISVNYQGRPVIYTAATGTDPNGTSVNSLFPTYFTSGVYQFVGNGSTAIQVQGNGSVVLGPTTGSYSYPTFINTYSGTILALQKANSTVISFDTTGSGAFNGNLSVAGTLTAGSVSNSGPSSATNHVATSNGTAAAPAYAFTAQADSGMYLAAASSTAAQLALAVNATQALLVSKGGVQVPGTLAVTGTTSVNGLTNAGTETAASFAISAAGGRLTFGDGTYMTTAATSAAATGSGTAGSAVAGSATSHVGPFGFSASSGTAKGINGGTWVFVPETTVSLTGASWFASATTAGSVTLGVYSLPLTNGQAAPTLVTTFPTVTVPSSGSGFVQNLTTPISLSPQYIYIVQTSGVTASLNGYLTIAEPLAVAGASAATQFTAGNGSDAAPGYTFTNQADTGVALAVASATAAQMDLSVNGTQVMALLKGGASLPGTLTVTGAQTFTGATTHAATVTSTTATGTPSFVSTQGFKQTVDMGTYFNGSGTAFPTSYVTMSRPVVQVSQTSYSFMPAAFVAPYAGSVLALSSYQASAVTSGQTVNMMVYVNGSATTLSTALSSTTGAASAYATATKGAIAFSAGQLVQVFIKGSSASVFPAYSATVTVEMAA